MTLTDILLTLILLVMIVNFVLNSAWWHRVRHNTPTKIKRITKRAKGFKRA